MFTHSPTRWLYVHAGLCKCEATALLGIVTSLSCCFTTTETRSVQPPPLHLALKAVIMAINNALLQRGTLFLLKGRLRELDLDSAGPGTAL